MAKATTITINGTVYSGKVDLVEALITSGMLTPVEAETKTAPKKETKSRSKKAASAPTVLKVDRYGNEWIGEYDQAQWDAMCVKTLGTKKNGEPMRPFAHSKRAEMYRELGWIL